MKFLSFVLALALAAVFFADKDLGVTPYPNATDLPDATAQLLQAKAPTWLAARAYRTDDSIKEVVKHFRDQAERAKKPVEGNEYLRRMLEDNWRITDGTVGNASSVFGASKELRDKSKEKTKTSFGVILLDDSIVRVHVVSPHPSSPTSVITTDGTMIVLIRERIPDASELAASASGDDETTAYTGREVTRKIRLRSKPDPQGMPPGVRGSVVLKVILSSSGKVENIVIVSGVPGLTEVAINAARRITFDPAIKDGRYVSQWIQLEYNFH